MMESDTKKAELAKAMADIEFCPIVFDKDSIIRRSTRIPLTELAVAGTAAASLLEPFRSITQTISSGGGETLYRAVFPSGVTGSLARFKDDSGYLSTIVNDSGIAGQARLQAVTGAPTSMVTTIPIDPMTLALALALALAQVNQKLDAIQKTQQEMFEYLKQKGRAELKGGLNTLVDVLNNYKYNWDNDKYKTNKHILVQDVKRSAEEAIVFTRSQIEPKIQKQLSIHLNNSVRKATEDIKSLLKDYQLSLYLYSFSSFLEVLLLENFNHHYLSSVAKKNDEYSIQYRELYTQCYNQIEGFADTSVQAHVLAGLSSFGKGAGGLVAKTPLGDKTQLGEALIEVGENAGSARRGSTDKAMQSIIEAKDEIVRPFIDNIKSMDQMYNEPTELLIGEGGIYVGSAP